MTSFMDDKTKKELEKVLEGMKDEVSLLYFTQESPCPMCREQLQILQEMASLTQKIKIEIHDFIKDTDKVLQYGIDKVPATVALSDKDYGIRFYGLTGGYEFASLIETVMMLSRGSSGLKPELEKLIRAIDEPLHLQVMVTLTCPYCSAQVHLAHQMAFLNDLIRGDMVETGEFPMLSQRYDVSSVPRTIINEVYTVDGALPPEAFYLEILKIIKPEEYQAIDDAIRESRGERHVRRPDPSHLYEVIIVGGGPAALSAALYAARKELDVLLVAGKLGGQVTYTAQVDNYLGFPTIAGKDMVEAFRRHVEHYSIAEALGHEVAAVEKKEQVFHVTMEDGAIYRGNAVIYCAGKEYRRLGVPGEERFIGKGIAFCATCDAPLYRGKRVAVVGGGNSAFTAVRDLLAFASEVHLIHRRDQFSADKMLVQEVVEAQNLFLYLNTIVREVIGDRRLSALRIMSSDGATRLDLPVEGVFLEIGLTPNSAPLKGIVELTGPGEIVVDKNNATSLAGFYAAGDVTDVEEKQISIAVGDGAKAALAAHRYLQAHRLTGSIAKAGSEWL
jgi:thioredoxin-disulfide reductase